MDGQSKDSLYLGRLTATLAAVFITLATLLSRFNLYGIVKLLSHAADDRNRNRMALGAYRTRWQQHCCGLYQTAIAA